MKRLLCCVLLLCLGLAGCDLAPVTENPMETPTLPVPVPPDPAEECGLPSQALSEPAATAPSDIWETVPPPGPRADVTLDPDVVTVHQEAIPTRIENEERWEGFLAAAERGEENGLTLRLIYEGGTYDLDLRYDGEVFTLVDEGITGTYKYLLASEEDTPRPGAKYRQAVHYLLSDDPDLTWEAYFARTVSSSVLFDQAAARSLFSVYE